MTESAPVENVTRFGRSRTPLGRHAGLHPGRWGRPDYDSTNVTVCSLVQPPLRRPLCTETATL